MSFLKELLPRPDSPPQAGNSPGISRSGLLPPASTLPCRRFPLPHRFVTVRSALRRVVMIAGVLLVCLWALLNIAATLFLVTLAGLCYLAALPVRGDLRLVRARLLPRYRRRLTMSEDEVDTVFRHIVSEEFGSSR